MTAIANFQDVLQSKPFDLDKLSALLDNEQFKEEISHDEAAWPALDAICDFLQSNEIELDSLHDLLCFLAGRANPREFILAISDRIGRTKNEVTWAYLLRPLAISINKHVSNRPADGTVEDAIYAAMSPLIFMNRNFDATHDPVEASEICSRKVVKLVDDLFPAVYQNQAISMYTIAACLTLAATPLSSIHHENKAWQEAVDKLCSVVLRYTNANALLNELSACSYIHEMFFGQYFTNTNGRWSHLKAGFACLLGSNNQSFYLPQMLEPRYRFFLCSVVVADLLAEITDTPNPDMDIVGNSFQSALACNSISVLLSSIPDESFNSECISSIPSFTLLIRRLFLNLTGSQSSFHVDVLSAGRLVQIIDVFMKKLDNNGKWQLIWMWLNQVPADGHPAGPVRAVAIDKLKALVASSLATNPAFLSEKLAKMLPMVLTLTLARDNVMDGQPGLIRVDAAISTLSYLQFVLLVPKEKGILDEQVRKMIAEWLEYEFRPSIAATRNFLMGASASNPQETAATAKFNPWTYFSGQLVSRLDMVQCVLARVEQIIEQTNRS